MNTPREGVKFKTAKSLAENAGISACVESINFSPMLDAPPDRPFPFLYAIVLCNHSPQAVTIKARKWVVTDQATGRCHVVEGDGVGGRTPRLEPGETFRFQNYHVVAANSVAEGSFLVCDDAGQPQCVRVPSFQLIIPATA